MIVELRAIDLYQHLSVRNENNPELHQLGGIRDDVLNFLGHEAFHAVKSIEVGKVSLLQPNAASGQYDGECTGLNRHFYLIS